MLCQLFIRGYAMQSVFYIDDKLRALPELLETLLMDRFSYVLDYFAL